jgi:uncharacterized membrane protein YgcG
MFISKNMYQIPVTFILQTTQKAAYLRRHSRSGWFALALFEIARGKAAIESLLHATDILKYIMTFRVIGVLRAGRAVRALGGESSQSVKSGKGVKSGKRGESGKSGESGGSGGSGKSGKSVKRSVRAVRER